MAVVREPIWSWLGKDILRMAFFVALAGGPVCLALIPSKAPTSLSQVGLRVVMALSAEFLMVFCLRLVLPKPRPGAHRVGWNGAYLRWLVSESFVATAMHPLLRLPFWHLHSTRYLYLKALGARLSWRVSTHEQLTIRNPGLVQIGWGTQLEPGVVIEAALHRAGRVLVAPVVIGKGCLLGAHSVLMPGATIGHEVRLEPSTIIGEDVHVGVGANIGEGVRLERGVDLGSYANVGTGCILSEGVRVGERAKIAAGSYVEPDTVIGEREQWAGIPARPVESSRPNTRA